MMWDDLNYDERLEALLHWIDMVHDKVEELYTVGVMDSKAFNECKDSLNDAQRLIWDEIAKREVK